MRLNEIVTESQLEEGPILNKIGTAVGNAVGTAAKGVGAVAGGIAGLGGALKKGYQAGKATVGAGGDEPAAGAPAAGAPAAGAPAAPAGSGAGAVLAGALGRKAYKGVTGYNTPGSDPGNAAVAKSAAPAAGEEPAATDTTAPAAGAPTAAQGTPAKPAAAPAVQATQSSAAGVPAAANPKADTAYSQAQKAIAALAPDQKQKIVAALQADPKVKAAMSGKPAAAKPNPAGAGAGAFGAMANNLKAGAAKPAAPAEAPAPQAAPSAASKGNFDPNTGAPISDKGKADAAASAAWDASPQGQAMKAKWDAEDAAAKQQAAPAAAPAPQAAPVAPGDEGKPGFLQSKIKGRRTPPAPSQAEIDADRERMMGNFTDSIERHKQRMVAESIKKGTASLYRKR